MLIKYNSIIYIPTLLMGTMITCSASSWIMAWVGLEINLMGFIPLIVNKLTMINMENAIKYFLIQAMASMIIILSILMYNFKLNFNKSLIVNYLITLSLGLKAGVSPLHFWFPQIMASLNWFQLIILSTWQKIAPLILLSFNFSMLMMAYIFLSAFTGSINGINQMKMKKLLAFSSIINLSWLITISLINMYSWWVYFLIYSLITMSVVMPSMLLGMTHLNLLNIQKINLINSIIIFMNLMSLAGLPPLTGFFIKIMIIDLMTTSSFSYLIIMTLLLPSVISLYFYLRVMYSMLFQTKKKSLLNNNNFYFKTYTPLFISISLTLNIFIPMMIILS